jgi:protein required for attachment to host cells
MVALGQCEARGLGYELGDAEPSRDRKGPHVSQLKDHRMTARITWILIADGARARVLETVGIGHKLVPVDRMTFAVELPPSRELGAGRPGRTHESVGDTRHAVAAKTDPHRNLKRAFAHDIAAKLDAELPNAAFDRLIVIAPPVTLGDLRASFSKAVQSRVTDEVAKDLVKVPNKDLRSHLVDVVGL